MLSTCIRINRMIRKRQLSYKSEKWQETSWFGSFKTLIVEYFVWRLWQKKDNIEKSPKHWTIERLNTEHSSTSIEHKPANLNWMIICWLHRWRCWQLMENQSFEQTLDINWIQFYVTHSHSHEKSEKHQIYDTKDH